MGAQKYSRVKRGIRDGMLINIGWATIAVAMVYFGGNFLVGLIVPKGNAAIVDTAVLYLRIAVLFYYCLGFLLGLRSALQGLGKSLVPIIASIIEMLWKVATVVWVVPLFGGKNGVPSGDIKEVGGYFGIMISEPIIWTVCAVMIVIIAVITLKKLPEDTAETEKETA